MELADIVGAVGDARRVPFYSCPVAEAEDHRGLIGRIFDLYHRSDGGRDLHSHVDAPTVALWTGLDIISAEMDLVRERRAEIARFKAGVR